MPEPSISLLWALRSRCTRGCQYCYFGTIEEHRASAPAAAGSLSHLSPDDITIGEAVAFASSLRGSAVRRVFLAGGSPWLGSRPCRSWPRSSRPAPRSWCAPTARP